MSLYAEFTAMESTASDVLQLIVDYGHTVRAEPGNIRFEILTRAIAPLEYVILETYVDQDAFLAHLNNPANAVFNERLAPHIREPASRLTWLTAAPPDGMEGR